MCVFKKTWPSNQHTKTYSPAWGTGGGGWWWGGWGTTGPEDVDGSCLLFLCSHTHTLTHLPPQRQSCTCKLPCCQSPRSSHESPQESSDFSPRPLPAPPHLHHSLHTVIKPLIVFRLSLFGHLNRWVVWWSVRHIHSPFISIVYLHIYVSLFSFCASAAALHLDFFQIIYN